MDCSLSGSSIHGILQAKNTGVGVPFPSPGNIPDPGIEPRSPALQQILYHLSQQGSLCCCYSVTPSHLTMWPPWTTAHQASLSFTISRSLLKLRSIESMMLSNHLIHFSCLLSFPASGSFLMSQLFASGGQSIGASASALVLPIIHF